MKNNFCPELQLDWRLGKISFKSFSRIKIKLYEVIESQMPSVINRHIDDIKTYPMISEVKNIIRFYFHNNIYFNIRDDSAPGYSEDDQGEGKTFQRLLKSELLTLHKNRCAGSNLKHYRIVCLNEILDIVSCEPPEIIIGIN